MLPATLTIPRVEPHYDGNTKTDITFPTTSAPWKIDNLITALRILYLYLQPRDSKGTLYLTIRGLDRQNAVLRIDKVLFEHSQAKYIAHTGSTELDTLDVYWYPNDRARLTDAISVLDQAREWAAGFPSERVVQVTDTKEFRSGSTLLSFTAIPTRAGWATMNFDEVYRAFTAVKTIGGQRPGKPWSAFRASVSNARDQYLGAIQYNANWPPSDVSVYSSAEKAGAIAIS